MGHAQDMLNLLRLAKNMMICTQSHFLFVGAGDEVEIMKDFIKKENIKILIIKRIIFQENYWAICVNQNPYWEA